ncbi:MAG: helix-turn-helix domain-containing protein [Bacillota bacterium]|nr:helix-turn-helix domain-containing protein [Bacillota bacterium]
MSVYDSIINGLNEAVDYENGKVKDVKVDHVKVASLPRFNGEKIKKIRIKQKMTQNTFSGVLGVSRKTVEAWESGRNIPCGPAQRMLELMDMDKDILEKYAILSRQ